MDSLSDILNIDYTLNHVKNGLVWIKSQVNLEFLGQKEVGVGQDDRNRKKALGKETGWEIPKGFDSLSGFMRRITGSIAQLTVYGKGQTVLIGSRQNSIFGLNKEALTTNGTLSYTYMHKHLREVNTSVELKEQRLNLYIDSVISRDFYDNATSLLYVMLLKLHLIHLSEITNKVRRELTIPMQLALRLAGMREEEAQPELRNYLMFTSKQIGIPEATHLYYRVYEQLLGIIATIDAPTRARLLTDIAAGNVVDDVKITVNAYQMYSYDDGHNRSGSHFGDHLDFVGGYYLHDDANLHVGQGIEVHITTTDRLIPDNDEAIRAIQLNPMAINASQLTAKELAIINWCLQGNYRSTPFLVDQDINLHMTGRRVRALYAREGPQFDFKLERNEMTRLIAKFVKVHRLHQELYNAKILMTNWLIQPATETFESHWWTHVNRTLRLPELGLMRANIPGYTDGEAVCITTDAINNYDRIIGPNVMGYVESALINTAWYWGEYLAIHNTVDTDTLIRNLQYTNDDRLPYLDRGHALASATLGRALPVVSFKDCGTYMTTPILEQTRCRISFGHIDIPHLVDYGYDVDGETVMLKKVVTPSAITLILGLDSTMLAGTPYAASFAIDPAVMTVFRGNKQLAYHYHDLWALGTVMRWNGHNLKYLHPLRTGVHKIYAANSVSVSMPPVPPKDMDYTRAYAISGVDTRHHTFGDGFEWARGCKLGFRWNRRFNSMLSTPDWNAAPSTMPYMHCSFPTRISYVPLQAYTYRAAIVTRFDVEQADFHFTEVQAGIPLPGPSQPSTLLPEEIPPDIPATPAPPPPPDGTILN
uniref:Capsid protein n=1 Tax=Uromyces fabae virus TaxID=3069272 RepID=A0AA51YGH0_9VIRU|nr:putative capsid protein [Uromyces fabae virus]